MTSLGTCKTAGPLDQLGTCIKLLLSDQLGTCKKAGYPMTSLVRAKQLVLLTNFGSCKKVGPWPTRCVHKVGSYQTSLVRARKLKAGYLMTCSWLGTCAKQLVLLTNFGSCKKVGPWPTRCVHKVGSYQISLVRGPWPRKLVIL